MITPDTPLPTRARTNATYASPQRFGVVVRRIANETVIVRLFSYRGSVLKQLRPPRLNQSETTWHASFWDPIGETDLPEHYRGLWP